MARLSAFAPALLLVLPLSLSARTWSDESGSYRIEAELLTVKEGKAYLEKTDGTVTAVPLEKLSKADRAYLAALPQAGAAPQPSAPLEPAVASSLSDISREVVSGEIRRFPDLGWPVKSLAFSPAGRLLAVGKLDRALAVFDVVAGQRTGVQEKLDALGEVTCLAFTPDGNRLLSGGYSGRVQVWSVAAAGTLTEASHFVGHSGEIHALAVSGDGRTAVSSGSDKKLCCWEVDTGRELFTVEGFENRIKAVYITRGGKQALACDGRVLLLAGVTEKKVLQKMPLGIGSPHCVAIAPNGSRVVVSDNYSLRSWDIRRGQEYPPLPAGEIQWSAAFTPDSRFLLSGGSGKVNVWELAKGRKLAELDVSGNYVQALAAAPDGRHCAAISSSAGQDLIVFRLPADGANP